MAELSIKTELDNLAYTPGDRLRGEVAWKVDLIKNSDGGEIRLFYYTAGKGTRDVETIETHAVDIRTEIGSQQFEFQLPGGPYSFSGKLVSLIWAVEFQVLESDETERLEFVLSPNGEEIDLYANSSGELPSYNGLKIGNG
jgi:hypothetical protein